MLGEETRTAVPTRDQIKKLIAAGDASAFIGLQETAFFEVREHRYDTTARDKVQLEKAKQTFVTDVSAIANSGGGYIMVGFTTETPPGTHIEYVKSVCGVDPSEIDTEALRTVLRDHTAPRLTLEDLKYGYVGDGAKSVLWIEVPDAQVTGQYPVITRRAKWGVGDDDFLKGEMFGLFHRDGAENLIESAERVQQLLAAAIQKDDDSQAITLARYQAIADKLDRLAELGAQAPKINSRDGVKDFLGLAKSGLVYDQGIFYILAKPTSQASFKDFWDSDYQHDNVYRLLKNPPTLRRMGWGLEVAGSEWPTPVGKAWEIKNGNSKLLHVTSDGEVFGAVSIDADLSWGTANYIPKDGSVNALINEVALIEYIYNFTVFVSALTERNGGVGDYNVYYGFDISKGSSVAMLVAERIGFIWYSVEGKLGDYHEWANKMATGELPQVAAARYALDIYRGGFSIAKTPLAIRSDHDGVNVIDPGFFRSLAA